MVKVDKTVKVDEHTYELINRLVGELRAEEGRPVSMNEALARLLEKKAKKRDIMDFAGSVKMSDKEVEKTKKELKKMWSGWKPRSL